MAESQILWVDDEIDLLKIHILFLEEKGHKVTTANNGDDALYIIKDKNFDIIFLDENMPGKSGIDVLAEIKQIKPHLPVIMITKNEEEAIMEEAIGSKIDDYLIKPVNPKQIILAVKKNVDNKRLISEKTTARYRHEFVKISAEINSAENFSDWTEIYKKIVFWDIELKKSGENTMDQILKTQKEEADKEFGKYIKKNYLNWFKEDIADKPNMPFDFIRKEIFPLLDNKEKLFLIVVDNLRYDQWKIVEPLVSQYMNVSSEKIFMSMLPSATQYARNALFAGLTPLEISKRYPQFWLNDEQEGGKNLHEKELLEQLFQRYRRKIKFAYEKIITNTQGRKINENINNYFPNQLNVIVFNFIDMLSHARTEIKMVQELAYDEKSYRALTLTWFEHSPLFELIKILSENKIKTVIITDHGTTEVHNPVKIIGDKNTSTNLRYKLGRNLDYDKNKVFEITKPETAGLPVSNISSSYVFALGTDFFAYPNNYNHYVKYYKGTLQHGGISLEELLIPYITLTTK